MKEKPEGDGSTERRGRKGRGDEGRYLMGSDLGICCEINSKKDW